MSLPAVILAAGRGSRLGALTTELPKCLIEIGDRAAIDHTFAALAAARFEKRCVVGGFAIDALRRQVSTQATVLPNAQWDSCGMLASYLCAATALSENGGLMQYGDVVTSGKNLERLMGHPGDIVVASNSAWRSLWAMRFEDPLCDAESFVSVDGRLAEIGQRVSEYDRIQGQFMGLLKFTAIGWRRFYRELLDPRTDLVRDDTTRVLRRLISANVRIDVVEMPGQWIEIDTPTDVEIANRILRERLEPHVWI